MTKNSKNVALVLSSGGARGIAHIGVIEALIANGYTISSIAGTSMGAVVGGVYAAGKLDEYKKWLMQLDRLEVFRLIDFTFSSSGFIRGEKVFREMKKFVKDKNIEDLNIPFCAVACDIVNRKEVVFESGNLYTALRASAAIPTVVTPSTYNKQQLVDGGVLNPIPVDHVKRSENDIVIIVDVNASIPYEKPAIAVEEKEPKSAGMFDQFIKKWDELAPNWKSEAKEKSKSKQEKLSYFELFNKSVNIMQDQISAHTIEKHQPDILVNVSREASSTFEFYRAEELIAAGRIACEKAINKQ